MEALAAALVALGTAIFTAVKMRHDYDRDYLDDLKDERDDAKKDRDDALRDRDAWKARALLAESQFQNLLMRTRGWDKEKEGTP